MDPQLTQLLVQMTRWLHLLTIVSITGFALLAAGLISSNIALHRMAQGMWLQLRRQYNDIDRDLQEIKDLLRG